MSTNPAGRPQLDLTVRVGCSLVYESAVPAVVLLNLRPRTDPQQALQEERLSFGENLPSEEFVDSHGNLVYRVMLHPGRNEIRHDAIVSVSSLPDNPDLPNAGGPVAPGDVLPAVLRYTLPSRYCDSDKLTDFAWRQFGGIEHGLPRIEA